jgi:hypothetical protein
MDFKPTSKILENFISFLTIGRTQNFDLEQGNYGQLKLGSVTSYSFWVLVNFQFVSVCFTKFNSFMHMHMQIMQYVVPIRSSPNEKFAHYIRHMYKRWWSHSSP